MNEIIFVIEEDPEGGYIAKALNHSIFTQGETIEELKSNINEAVLCHFDEKDLPKIARMHFVRDEVFAIA
jgi:predicted RNase H-like HicB family nuclease